MKDESSEPTVFGLIAPSLGKAGRPFAKTRSLLVMSLPVVLCPVMISAQAVSGVTGTVTDPNGAAVAGAQVTLTNTKTSRELKVTTNGEGSYTFNNVQPGAVGTNARVTSATLNANRLGSVTGSRADQGNITVDGIDANDVATGQAFATVANAPIDSIQELRGISVAPIFFFDLERRRDRSQQNNSRTAPLQSFREGRIGYIRATPVGSSTPCPANSRLDTRPDCIEFLTPAQIAALDPQGRGFNQELLSFINSRYPQANDLSGGNGVNTGLFRFNAPFNSNDSIYTGRVDANLTDSQRLFVRTTITRRDLTNTPQQFSGDEDAVALSTPRELQFAIRYDF